ncbi:hypothetical protein GF337_14755 [candidate division KSB1 bacterium]|nr:hypothetical protein [candidate division KSB1 bacterium]
MNITSQHVTGFVVGVGAAGLGFYLYKKNQPQVDEFLRRQGIQLPVHSVKDYASMSLEELVSEKENLEDLIAEREQEAKEEAK